MKKQKDLIRLTEAVAKELRRDKVDLAIATRHIPRPFGLDTYVFVSAQGQSYYCSEQEYGDWFPVEAKE